MQPHSFQCRFSIFLHLNTFAKETREDTRM